MHQKTPNLNPNIHFRPPGFLGGSKWFLGESRGFFGSESVGFFKCLILVHLTLLGGVPSQILTLTIYHNTLSMVPISIFQNFPKFQVLAVQQLGIILGVGQETKQKLIELNLIWMHLIGSNQTFENFVDVVWVYFWKWSLHCNYDYNRCNRCITIIITITIL